MKPRRPCRRRLWENKLWMIQRVRLRMIERGEIQPACDRERFFLWTLRERGRAKPANYILPGLLFLAEKGVAQTPLTPPPLKPTASPPPTAEDLAHAR